MAHPNEELVRQGYKAFSAGDMDALADIMVEDVVHVVPGNNQTSGEHKGRDAVFAMYGKLFELSGGTLLAELERVEAQGDNRVVTTHHATAERQGRKLDVRESITFTIEDGQIIRLDETTEDEAAEDAFWG